MKREKIKTQILIEGPEHLRRDVDEKMAKFLNLFLRNKVQEDSSL